MTLPLILASASQSRKRMLDAAGLIFEVIPSPVDETELKTIYGQQGVTGADMAGHLAAAKARSVSRMHPEACVIGADQILLFDGAMYDKPENMDVAADLLRKLRGRTHQLACAVCVVQGDKLAWQHAEVVELKMWDFSDAFLEEYLVAAGSEILTSVGAYQLEGLGARLFANVSGDYFTILGLPLLPLLAYLRTANMLPS